jgi:hypothetical protein
MVDDAKYEDVMSCIEANMKETLTLIRAALDSAEKMLEPDTDGTVACQAAEIIEAYAVTALTSAESFIRGMQTHLASQECQDHYIVRQASAIIRDAFDATKI